MHHEHPQHAAPPEIGCTYRLQLNRDFDLDAAASAAEYLARLGVTHAYTSPCLQAVPGSTHGYDVVDHGRVSADLGGEAAHARFVDALGRVGLGHVLDIVPNHMAIAGGNGWWRDVLEHGPASRYASHFDVDWDPPEARLRNVVLLPVLPEHYGRVLEEGGLHVVRERASLAVAFGEDRYPLDPRSVGWVVARAAAACADDRLAFIGDALVALPAATATDHGSVRRRYRDTAILHADLERLLDERPDVAAAVDGAIAELNRDADALDALLDRQNYRLAWWRAAGRDLGYRRFFDINTLVALRTEDEQVFDDTHRLVLDWVARRRVDGLRIDHVDGLRDPAQYLERLRAGAGNAWIAVEKILEREERLPNDWPGEGTTGYDFLNRVAGLFVDPRGQPPLTDFYGRFTGEPVDYAAVARERKLLVLRDVLGSDVNRLAALFLDVCERHRRLRDYTRHELAEALRETLASVGVYRTYIRPATGVVSETDARRARDAIETAKKHRPDLDPTLLDFLRDILLLRVRGTLESELVMRFQQLSAPAMAKGVEDTAFYAYARFVALNEVGGDPGCLGTSTADFHRAMGEALERWPRGLLATATHDTKRGEDVRARLWLLSEIPDRWIDAVRRWSGMLDGYRRHGWPDRLMEYLFYQTVVGAWPLAVDRAVRYVEKASREAKLHTSWTRPEPVYDDALRGFVEAALADARFVADVETFVASLVPAGRVNALAQTLLKLTAPGVPDIYQGTEVWSLDLVDPDNRRPVDYELRRRLLAEVEPGHVDAIVRRADDGLPKLWVIRQALALRRRIPEAFGPAARYRPIPAAGAKAAHAVAFARGERVITVVPRLVLGLGGDWADTTIELPGGRWRNELTNERVPAGPARLAALLERFPVALLARDAA